MGPGGILYQRETVHEFILTSAKKQCKAKQQRTMRKREKEKKKKKEAKLCPAKLSKSEREVLSFLFNINLIQLITLVVLDAIHQI